MIPVAGKFTVDLLKEHQIYRCKDGGQVRGASTIAKLTKNYEALMKWHNKQGRAGIDTSVRVKEAADAGTLAHGMIEAWLLKMEFDEEKHRPDLLDRARLGFERFKPWWKDQGFYLLKDEHGPVVERELVSEYYRFGGTPDILALRGFSILGGKVALLDIKTSDSGVWRDMIVQAFGYDLLIKECLGFTVDEVWIVRVGKEKTAEIECKNITHERENARLAFLAAHELDKALWEMPEAKPVWQRKR